MPSRGQKREAQKCLCYSCKCVTHAAYIHDGISVPFAVEERSGTITVVEDIERFDRFTYDFEAVVTDERELSLITNVSIHVVDPNDDRSTFTK